MIKRYAFPGGGVNTPPPNPKLTIAFTLGPFNTFTFTLSRVVDGPITINRLFVDTFIRPGSAAVGSAQMNYPPYVIDAGTTGGSRTPDTTTGNLNTANGYNIYNVLINGTTVADGQDITIGSYTVRVHLVTV